MIVRITVLFLLFPILCSSQEMKVPVKDGQMFYEVVVESDLSKGDLYGLVKRYFVNGFKNSKAVIQLDDKESGEIIGKGTSTYYYTQALQGHQDYGFTLGIAVKDKKYRIQLYDFTDGYIQRSFQDYQKKHQRLNLKMLEGFHSNNLAIIESVKGALSANHIKKDDW